MSLISDTNFLIHSIRLNYLRDVDDPYGPRILALDPYYQTNPYIHAASLTDVERWPELAMPSSPPLSDDDGERPTGFPRAKLKYTQTITGGRRGGIGIRVNGKAVSDSKRFSGTARPVDDSSPLTPAPSAKPETEAIQEPPPNPEKRPPPPAVTVTMPPPELDFQRKAVLPIRPQKSALSAMLASSGSSSNPFSEFYAAISGRSEGASTNVRVYFPHAKHPAGEPMELNVRKDAMVEEVIGYALWSYWEEGWLPKLNEGISGEDDPQWQIKLSAVGWILRLAEDDGEVDDDFPPPDRLAKITGFPSDAYAILEANPTQVQRNQVLESKIVRRPSRTTLKKPTGLPPPSSNLAPSVTTGGGSSIFGATSTSLPLSTSLGPSSSHGPQIFLRIRVGDSKDEVHVSTTIPVSAGMYMQEALEMVCRRRKISDPNDYVLLISDADAKLLIPLDRTVASLQGKRELLLVKKTSLAGMGIDITKVTGKTTDPNASVFEPIVEPPPLPSAVPSTLDYASAYKEFTIYRKLPMLVTRQERTLALDGVYMHIMPSATKARVVFDHGKTSSYHVRIVDCSQSSKNSAYFKVIINKGAGGSKRYDFEAESAKHAAEIVSSVKAMKNAVERSGTVHKPRKNVAPGL
ncbi:hypothetical protein AX16_002486 [Volvariella volvacea WC 439]|nr:hypothetical protein AX16_002486 [Volvariella volvacea WC 439]